MLLDQAVTLVPRDGELVLAEELVDDRLDLAMELSRIGDVNERLEGDRGFVLDAKPDVAQKHLPSRSVSRLQGRRRLDRFDLAGTLGVGSLLRPFNPPEQGHDVHLPRHARWSTTCGDPGLYE